MGSTEEDERWVMMAVLDHLQQKATSGDGSNRESLQEAIFAISNAYMLNMHSSSTKARYPIDGLSLPAVYKAGRSALLSGPSNSDSNQQPPSNSTPAEAPPLAEDPPTSNATLSNDPAFDKFLQRLRDTTGFFDGVAEGSDEFKKRLSHARSKYDERIAAKKQRIERPTPTNATDPAPTTNNSTPPTVNVNVNISGATGTTETADAEEKIARAAELKERGNAQLKAKQFEAALKSYTEAISLDPQNAIYYSNRAAANLRLSRFSHAVDDCKKAINLDSSFVRPRERLATAYRYLGMTRQEVDALRDTVALDSSNTAFQNQLRDAEGRLSAENASGGTTGTNPSGMDANMLSMMANSMGLGVPPGIAESVASFVRDNPAVLERFMQMMGPGGPAAGAQGQSNGTDRNRGP